jgi:hypothetical protein
MSNVKQIVVPEGWMGVCDWTTHPGPIIPDNEWRPLKADEQIPKRATAIRVLGRRICPSK